MGVLPAINLQNQHHETTRLYVSDSGIAEILNQTDCVDLGIKPWRRKLCVIFVPSIKGSPQKARSSPRYPYTPLHACRYVARSLDILTTAMKIHRVQVSIGAKVPAQCRTHRWKRYCCSAQNYNYLT